MRVVLSLLVLIGLLLLPGRLGAQVAAPASPAVPEADEVRIETPTLPPVGDILAPFTDPAVREVEIRGLDPRQVNVEEAFLTAGTSNVLVQVGSQLPEGTRVDFRTVDGQRFRVQNEEGQLRVRVREVVLGEADRAALAAAFSDAGFGRVEIRGFDAAGNRIRLEVRDGVVRKDETRLERSGRGREGTSATINDERARDRGRDLEHSLLGRDRAERERERAGARDRAERSRRGDRSGRGGRH